MELAGSSPEGPNGLVERPGTIDTYTGDMHVVFLTVAIITSCYSAFRFFILSDLRKQIERTIMERTMITVGMCM